MGWGPVVALGLGILALSSRRSNGTGSGAPAPEPEQPTHTPPPDESTPHGAAVALAAYWDGGGRDRTRIARWQRTMGIHADGYVGPDTVHRAEALGAHMHTAPEAVPRSLPAPAAAPASSTPAAAPTTNGSATQAQSSAASPATTTPTPAPFNPPQTPTPTFTPGPMDEHATFVPGPRGDLQAVHFEPANTAHDAPPPPGPLQTGPTPTTTTQPAAPSSSEVQAHQLWSMAQDQARAGHWDNAEVLLRQAYHLAPRDATLRDINIARDHQHLAHVQSSDVSGFVGLSERDIDPRTQRGAALALATYWSGGGRDPATIAHYQRPLGVPQTGTLDPDTRDALTRERTLVIDS